MILSSTIESLKTHKFQTLQKENIRTLSETNLFHMKALQILLKASTNANIIAAYRL